MSHSSSFVRTDKAIMQAFIDLLKEKSFEKITVQDILDKTPVTRATFYAHYHDKYEIAERMLEQFFQLRNATRAKLETVSSSKMDSIIRKIYSEAGTGSGFAAACGVRRQCRRQGGLPAAATHF